MRNDPLLTATASARSWCRSIAIGGGAILLATAALAAPVPAATLAHDAPHRAVLAPERTSVVHDVVVPLRDAGHLGAVDVLLDGKGPYRVAIDSGSSGALSVSPRVAAELALEPFGEAVVGDPSGHNLSRRKLARVARLEIGEARFEGVVTSIDERALGGTDGVVGLALFRGLTATLDYPRGELRLSHDPVAAGDAHVVPFTIERGIPTIDVDAGGASLHVDVDTGSPALLTIPSGWASRVRLAGEPHVVGHARTVANELDVLGADLDGVLRVAGWSRERPQVDLVDVFPVANLGARFLRGYAVSFDMTNRRMALRESAQATAAVENAPSEGAPTEGTPTLGTPTQGAASTGVAPELRSTVDALVAALAAGDPAAWETLAQQRFAAALLARRTPEQRRESIERLHRDLGTLAAGALRPDGPWSADVDLRGNGDAVATLHVELEPDAPHRVRDLGLRVEAGGGGEHAPALPRPLPELPRADRERLASTLDGYLTALAADGELSGVVLVARDGEPLFAHAYGVADRETGAANALDTRFNVASIGKMLTRVAIAQLLAAGKLTLDEPLMKILPAYPNREAAAKITVQQLLEHQAGVVDIFDVLRDAPSPPASNHEWYALVAPRPLLFAPGSQTRYCNGCYVVLGEIVAALSGTSYESYLATHVLAPAGMRDTAFLGGDVAEPRKARGYTRRGAGLELASLGKGGRGSGAGGIFATAADLLAFDNALRTYRLVDRERTSWVLSGGDVTGSRAHGGLAIAGGTPGTNALLDSDGTWTVVVLTNRDPRLAETLGTAIARELRR